MILMFFANSLYMSGAEISVIAVSVTAAFAAVATPIAIWWRKTKKKVAKTLHIDENAGKEVEEELVIKDETEATAEETKEADNNGKN